MALHHFTHNIHEFSVLTASPLLSRSASAAMQVSEPDKHPMDEDVTVSDDTSTSEVSSPSPRTSEDSKAAVDEREGGDMQAALPSPFATNYNENM